MERAKIDERREALLRRTEEERLWLTAEHIRRTGGACWAACVVRDLLKEALTETQFLMLATDFLYSQQTTEEKVQHQTIELNYVGFNIGDAPVLSRIAFRWARGFQPTDDEQRTLRDGLWKYWSTQLVPWLRRTRGVNWLDVLDQAKQRLLAREEAELLAAEKREQERQNKKKQKQVRSVELDQLILGFREYCREKLRWRPPKSATVETLRPMVAEWMEDEWPELCAEVLAGQIAATLLD